MITTRLANDLDILILSFETVATREQKFIWKKTKRGKTITHAHLGCDHPTTLRLLTSLGGDGQPLTRLGQKACRNIWSYGSDHCFLSLRDLVRICVFFQLSFIRSLALILKGLWETHLGRQVGGYKTGCSMVLSDLLQDPALISEAERTFLPDRGEIFRCLEQHGKLAVPDGLDSSSLAILVQEMVMLNLHRFSQDSPELLEFEARDRTERDLLLRSTPDQQTGFFELKSHFLQLNHDLEVLLELVESRRLENARILKEWLRIYGHDEVSLREASCRVRRVTRMLKLKKEEPELTREELDRRLQGDLEDDVRSLDDLRTRVAMTHTCWVPDRSEGGFDLDAYRVYRGQCRRLLKELRFLTNGDRLRLDPAWGKLTEEQRDALENLERDAVAIKTEDLNRESIALESIAGRLELARSILGLAGLELNPHLMIPQEGGSPAAQILWLQAANERLARMIHNSQTELKLLCQDPDTSRMAAALAEPACHGKLHDGFREATSVYERTAKGLELQIEELFSRSMTHRSAKEVTLDGATRAC